jgi:putative FmdB family regulatory protein
VPTYQYACTECGEQLEAFQSFSDPALTECPNCQGRLRKVFNSVGIVFKGSGFYRNDSRAGSGSSPDKAGAEKPAEAASATASKTSDSGTAKSSDSSSSSTSSSSSPASSSSSTSSSGSGAKAGAATSGA